MKTTTLVIDSEKKILTIDGKEYNFTEILMTKDSPLWTVKLIDGGMLVLNFPKEKE